MPARELQGEPASPGDAVGRLWRAPTVAAAAARTVPEAERPGQLELARRGLEAAAAQLRELAATLPPAEVGILEANIMMASDPLLTAAVERHVREGGLPAASALVAAAEDQARTLEAIEDAHLAARADDLRSLGQRAARAALAGGERPRAPAGAIVLAADLGPGDVSELAGRAAGLALAGGGATTHAAIVARSLGVPMLCELGPELLALADGAPALLDGERRLLAVEPGEEAVAAVAARIEAARAARERDRRDRELPAVTRDGHPVTVLANVASPAEVEVAVEQGAAGVGLLRTELAFLEARSWPTVAEHEASLRPLLRALGGRPAVVRTLDLGGDKTPPFLAPGPDRGLRLMLANRPRFVEQLQALLRLSREFELRLLLPLVEGPAQLGAARELIAEVAACLGLAALPPLGAMVETPPAAAAAAALAADAAFLSIGTNDLAAATFERDRFAGGVPPAHHPRLLAEIEKTVAGAHAAGVPVEVCGEGASNPTAMPLLVGLGVDELSVGAAAVGEVRRWVRALSRESAAALATRALAAASAEEVEALVAAEAA